MSKKIYCQYFRPAYKNEFPTIKESLKGNMYAYCNVCVCDFVISHGGRSDILKHIASNKHKINSSESSTSKKVDNFFSKSVENADTDVIRAECLFTAFLIEHNVPLSAADHAGPLFRKMFPDSKIAIKYACARTKTSAIVNEIACDEQKKTITALQNAAFSVAIDGSNDSDWKLYPIVVTYFCNVANAIKSHLLCLPILNEDSTGKNIAQLIINELKVLDIPMSNCISFSADNAAVMLGAKNGVVSFLKEHQNELIIIGCPCHLVNLAAEKAAAALPVNIDQLLIDIFYYLDKSVKRKSNLKKFQELCSNDTKKILKHVSTRWLSLGRALKRLIEQWDPLLKYFHEEIKTKPRLPSNLTAFKIPKLTDSACEENSLKRKHPVEANTSKKKCIENTKRLFTEAQAKNKSLNLNREERIFYFLSSDLNKAFCNFVLNTLPIFEKVNVILQSASPKIPLLHQILNDLLKELFSKFLKPSVVKSSDLKRVSYNNLDCQKADEDLIIGNQTREILISLKDEDKKDFFLYVRKYFSSACDYILRKFPLQDEVLINAQVANLKNIENSSFAKIRFFVNKFPFLLTVKENESHDVAMDELESQFSAAQFEDFSNCEEKFDVLIDSLKKIKRADGLPKYDRLVKVLCAILTIPHSNAECERIFSVIKKNKTLFRSSMSPKTLENILIVKSHEESNCYDRQFCNALLVKAKKATVTSLH